MDEARLLTIPLESRYSGASLILTHNRVVRRESAGFWGEREKTLDVSQVSLVEIRWTRLGGYIPASAAGAVITFLGLYASEPMATMIGVAIVITFVLALFLHRVTKLRIATAAGEIEVSPADLKDAQRFADETWKQVRARRAEQSTGGPESEGRR